MQVGMSYDGKLSYKCEMGQQLDFLISPLLQQSAFSKYGTVGKYHKGLVNNSDLHPLKLLFIHTYYTNTKHFCLKTPKRLSDESCL